jgi:Spy/CpxP family protein refolding chaperone
MRTKYIVGALLAVLLLGLGTILFAHVRWGGPLGHGGQRGEGAFLAHLTRRLDLTPAQQTEVKQMWQAEKPAVVPLVQQLASLNKQMAEATSNGTFDQAKVTAIANQESQLVSQLIVEKEKLTVKFYTLLTPEQRTKFDTVRQRRLTRIDEFVQQMAGETSK